MTENAVKIGHRCLQPCRELTLFDSAHMKLCSCHQYLFTNPYYLIPPVQQGGHCSGDTQQDLQHFGQVVVDEVP